MPDIEQLTADEVQRRRMRITRLESEYSKLDARIETLVEVREEMRAELRELHEQEDRRPDELAVPDDMLAAAPTTARLRTPESEIIEVARRLGTFTLPELAAPLGVKVIRLKSVVAGLCESGKLCSTGRKYYGRPMYQYVPPEDPGAAFAAQQREVERPGRNGNGAQPVPYTGKPVGASGKPGRDREVARQGRRVKTKHGKA